jgi:hypothetical protein
MANQFFFMEQEGPVPWQTNFNPNNRGHLGYSCFGCSGKMVYHQDLPVIHTNSAISINGHNSGFLFTS